MLEYEGLHVICFTCTKYGHKVDGCTFGSDRALVIVNPNSVVAKSVSQESLATVDNTFGGKFSMHQNEAWITLDKATTYMKETDFGPWKIVNPSQKRKGNIKLVNLSKDSSKSSNLHTNRPNKDVGKNGARVVASKPDLENKQTKNK